MPRFELTSRISISLKNAAQTDFSRSPPHPSPNVTPSHPIVAEMPPSTCGRCGS
jgi:hypothetical protein